MQSNAAQARAVLFLFVGKGGVAGKEKETWVTRDRNTSVHGVGAGGDGPVGGGRGSKA